MKNPVLTIVMIMAILVTGTAACFAAEGKQGAAKVSPPPQAQSAQTADEKAVRASAEEFVAAFNKGDAKAIGALWTEDGEYSDEAGRVFRGRDAVEKAYATFFDRHPGLKMESAISSLRIVGGNAAVEQGTSIVKDAKGALLSKGHYTTVLLREGDTWRMASVREHAAPSVAARPDFRDLEWLIGDWTASKEPKHVDLNFRWVADKRFIELSYAAREKDAVARSGIQIIGRDPLSGDVISWSFDSGGGYARGQWKLLKNGCVIENRGVMPDGAAMASTDIISRTGGDRFTWQSVNREVAGRSLNDSESVELTRKSR